MSSIVKWLPKVLLFVLETVIWVFIVKTFEAGFKQLKSWRSKPTTLVA